MSAQAAGLSGDPRDDGVMEGIHVALDQHGNPVCQGCGAGAFTWAALGNSGWTRRCYCPPEDRRVTDVDTRAEALWRIIGALDLLDRLDHSLTCRCAVCDAVRLLRVGDPR